MVGERARPSEWGATTGHSFDNGKNHRLLAVVNE